MRNAIQHLVSSLDDAQRLALQEIHFDGNIVRFIFDRVSVSSDSASDPVENWLTKHGAED